MCAELSREDTTALIRRFAAGEDDALNEYLVRYKGKLLRAAIRSLRKLRIDEADLDVEGAVDMAFGEVAQLRDRCLLDSIADSDEFLKLMIQHTEWIINDQKKRSDAAKRGGPRGHHRTEVDLDQFVSREPPVEDVGVTEFEIQALLERLPDDVHRTIFKMRRQGYSIEEIAHRLGLVRRTIEYKLETIEEICLKYILKHESDENGGANASRNWVSNHDPSSGRGPIP